MISFKPLNDTYDAIKAPSTDERKKKINRKRRNEIIHAAKFLYEKCKHYKCEVFSMEDLCFKDDKKKKKNGKKKNIVTLLNKVIGVKFKSDFGIGMTPNELFEN